MARIRAYCDILIALDYKYLYIYILLGSLCYDAFKLLTEFFDLLVFMVWGRCIDLDDCNVVWSRWDQPAGDGNTADDTTYFFPFDECHPIPVFRDLSNFEEKHHTSGNSPVTLAFITLWTTAFILFQVCTKHAADAFCFLSFHRRERTIVIEKQLSAPRPSMRIIEVPLSVCGCVCVCVWYVCVCMGGGGESILLLFFICFVLLNRVLNTGNQRNCYRKPNFESFQFLLLFYFFNILQFPFILLLFLLLKSHLLNKFLLLF